MTDQTGERSGEERWRDAMEVMRITISEMVKTIVKERKKVKN